MDDIDIASNWESIDMSQIGDNFQKDTKYQRNKMLGKGLDWSLQPKLYKEYPDNQIIDLPEVRPLAEVSLHDAIKNRRSIRNFKKEVISKESLSYLLWASTGISRKEGNYEFRTAPSAGALYPIETYLCVNNVEGIEAGIFHYSIKDHQLNILRKGNFAIDLTRAALDQRMCLGAAVTFIWTAIFQRSKWKYEQRAYRYVYLDAGHIAENLALAATSVGLGSCQIGALFDDEVNNIIEVDGTEESVIYMSTVGSPV